MCGVWVSSCRTADVEGGLLLVCYVGGGREGRGSNFVPLGMGLGLVRSRFGIFCCMSWLSRGL
jgi:hypothetical protein